MVRTANILDLEHLILPYITRFEFAMGPMTTFSRPDRFSMKITHFVNRQWPEFTQLIAGLSQEERQRLDEWARKLESRCQETFHAIARLLDQKGQLYVVEPADYYDGENWGCNRSFVTTPYGRSLGVVEVPSWVIVSHKTLKEVREKLQSVFRMELEEI